MGKITTRQAAEAIEQFGEQLDAMNRAFSKLCEQMSFHTVVAIDHIPDQEKLGEIAEGFRKLGDQLIRQCDQAEEAEDRRRDNPLEPDFRRLGQ